MTYGLGWKTLSGVLLVADSALTSLVRTSVRAPPERTSFGELQGEIHASGGKCYEAEEGLKISV